MTRTGHAGLLRRTGKRWPAAIRLESADGERLVVAVEVPPVTSS